MRTNLPAGIRRVALTRRPHGPSATMCRLSWCRPDDDQQLKGDQMRPEAEATAVTYPEQVTIRYRNYKGETAWRRIVPQRIWFGSTRWHPESQWIMEAIDLDKNSLRSFALRDVLEFDSSDRIASPAAS